MTRRSALTLFAGSASLGLACTPTPFPPVPPNPPPKRRWFAQGSRTTAGDPRNLAAARAKYGHGPGADLSLDVAEPSEVARVLRRAALHYRTTAGVFLEAQDARARSAESEAEARAVGRVWLRLATTLEAAAGHCESLTDPRNAEAGAHRGKPTEQDLDQEPTLP